jgi:hypothetical protein
MCQNKKTLKDFVGRTSQLFDGKNNFIGTNAVIYIEKPGSMLASR